MKEIVIVGGVRTPFGKLGGSLRQFHMADLAGMTIRALVEQYKIEPAQVDAVFVGSPLPRVPFRSGTFSRAP